jgi:hypothetical protein
MRELLAKCRVVWHHREVSGRLVSANRIGDGRVTDQEGVPSNNGHFGEGITKVILMAGMAISHNYAES